MTSLLAFAKAFVDASRIYIYLSLSSVLQRRELRCTFWRGLVAVDASENHSIFAIDLVFLLAIEHPNHRHQKRYLTG